MVNWDLYYVTKTSLFTCQVEKIICPKVTYGSHMIEMEMLIKPATADADYTVQHSIRALQF